MKNPRYQIWNPIQGMKNLKYQIWNPIWGMKHPRYQIWNPIQGMEKQLGMSILAEISRAYDRMKVLIFDKVSISRYLRKMFLIATFDWSNVYTQINWGGYSISFSVICNMIQSRGSNTFLFIRSNYGKCCNSVKLISKRKGNEE